MEEMIWETQEVGPRLEVFKVKKLDENSMGVN